MKRFSFNTITDFDEHIRKSIPSYELLQQMIINLSDYYIQEEQVVYDLGCSTGQLLKNLPADVRKVGYDNSNLLPKNSYKNLDFIRQDITKEFSLDNACLVFSIFTLQFIPKKSRQILLNKVFDGLNSGGALLLCEKVYSDESCFQESMSMCYYQHKQQNFTLDEIFQKEKDLRQIMKPNTFSQNEFMLNQAGFRKIQPFWRFYNFVGLIAIKD